MAAHDATAGHEFVNRWNERIRQWVARQAAHEMVEEYVQEVWEHLIDGNWLRLLQWKGLYDDEAWHPHSLEAFLKRVTINKVTSLQRAERQSSSSFDPVDIIDDTTSLGADPALYAERARLMLAFTTCSSRFSDGDHRAIVMWWEGHTAQYIAEQLHTNANNVYQRRHYLLNQLRTCLVEKLPEYFRHV